MEAQIMASIGVCTEFLRDAFAEKAELSVVIAPLKITEDGSGKVQITSGCNFWRSCHNLDCYYSIAARDINRPQPGK
jgi:hypothetical protein